MQNNAIMINTPLPDHSNSAPPINGPRDRPRTTNVEAPKYAPRKRSGARRSSKILKYDKMRYSLRRSETFQENSLKSHTVTYCGWLHIFSVVPAS